MADTLYDRLKAAVDDIRRNGVGGVRFPEIRIAPPADDQDGDIAYVNEVNPARPWEEGDWNDFSEFDEHGAIQAALDRLKEAAGPDYQINFSEGCHEAEFVKKSADETVKAEQQEALLAAVQANRPVKKRPHLDSYDGHGLDDKVIAVLDEYDVREEFLDWLDCWLALNANATIDDGPDLPCQFRIEGSENPLDPKPYVALTLKVTTDTVSGYSPRNGDFDVTTLTVELTDKAVVPNVSGRVLEVLKQTVVPVTAEALATLLGIKKHRVYNALISLKIPELVDEVPLPDNPRLSGWQLQRGA
jgi:hypothetical protein